MSVTKLIQKVLKSAGLELVPHPPSDWVACRNILRNVLNKLSINCVLDVGANRGQYGSMLRDIGYRGQIFSFEPVRDHFEALSACAASQGPWKCFNYALGARNEQAEINVTDEDVFSSFLAPREDSQERFPRNRVTRSETVQVRRLDSVLSECIAGVTSARIYLKMDTQGFDLEVLAGAAGVLPSVMALQSEVSFRPIYYGMPGYQDSLRELQALGFGVVDFIPVNRDSGGLCSIEMDCVMARTGLTVEKPVTSKTQ
jgi:FkbM family methyltransferase